MFERLCRHEAGHAAAALLLGLDVRELKTARVDLSVEPADEDAGRRLPRWFPPRPRRPRRVATVGDVTLAGPIEDGGDWPPR